MRESLITPAMRDAVGRPGQLRSAIIERGAIIRFADAIGDGNPTYRTETPVAPPTFLRAIGSAIPSLPDGEQVPRVLDGGSDWTYAAAVRAGDTIMFSTRLESLTERLGRLGPMLFAVYYTEYKNEDGSVAATQRNTVIRMRASR